MVAVRPEGTHLVAVEVDIVEGTDYDTHHTSVGEEVEEDRNRMVVLVEVEDIVAEVDTLEGTFRNCTVAAVVVVVGSCSHTVVVVVGMHCNLEAVVEDMVACYNHNSRCSCNPDLECLI